MKSFHARVPKQAPTATGGALASPPETNARPRRARDGLVRADALLVTSGLASSRASAQRLIEAGRVGWRAPSGFAIIAKPSYLLPDKAELGVAASDADGKHAFLSPISK